MCAKRIIKGNFILLFIILLLIISTLGISKTATAYASLDFSFLEEDFTFIPDPSVGSLSFTNATAGARIRINMTEAQVGGIISVKYTLVKIKNIDDRVTFDENNIYINSKAITATDEIENKTILKSQFLSYPSPKENKYSYIDIVAKEWCAIVIDVNYNVGNGNQVSYDSYVYNVTNIDNSNPSAYYRTWSFDSGAYTFKVTVNGNAAKAPQSANSGIKKIEFVREIVNGNDIQVTLLDTIENITSHPYYYDLRAETTQKAFYYARVTDWVGNYSKNLIVTFGSYDASFESAVNNTLAQIERAKEIFSPYILKNMTDGYASYSSLVQSYYAEGDEVKRQKITDQISAQKVAVYKLMGDYANVRTLAENGVRDYNLKVVNPEYLEEGVYVGNVNAAYTALLYGEVANFTIALADFDLKKVDKKAEIAAAEIIKAERVLGLTLETVNSVTGDVDITFTAPIDIRLPLKDFKAVSAVVKRTIDGVDTFEKLKITEYKNYILVHMPYSKGVISVVLGQKAVSPFYWFFTLLVLPFGAGIFVLVKLLKKKNLAKKEQLEKEMQEAKAQVKNYVAKNKSKKGKKKK